MAVQRRSQIPKAPERSVLDSIVSSPVEEPAPTISSLTDSPAQPSAGSVVHMPVQTNDDAPVTPAPVAPTSLQAPARRQRKPTRILYTSKMDPDLKAWAMSYKRPGGEGEDFVEVVEQALWVLRLARSGQMSDAVVALERAAAPFD